MEFEVLNGTVRVGDTVAYAVRDGNLAEMVTGVVVGWEEHKKPYTENQYVTRLKIRVTRRSGGMYLRQEDRICGVEKLDRVVKL